MFVQWSCGCIGLPQKDSEGRSVVIDHCDSSSGELAFSYRDQGDKTYEPVNGMAEANFVIRLGKLINDGYRLRDIQRILKS